jgi:hypothetical protein
VCAWGLKNFDKNQPFTLHAASRNGKRDERGYVFATSKKVTAQQSLPNGKLNNLLPSQANIAAGKTLKIQADTSGENELSVDGRYQGKKRALPSRDVQRLIVLLQRSRRTALRNL